jgi:pyrroloquinoline quinone biosynthesis protein E
LLTGDAAETDPVCSKSAHHEKVVEVVRDAPRRRNIPIVFRSDAESKALHEPPRSAPAAVAAPQGGAFTASGGRAP